MNEILYGSNSKTCDDEGYEIETHSCKDYAYFSYPNYISKEYDAFLLRTMAGILVPFKDDLKDGEKIVVLETEG